MLFQQYLEASRPRSESFWNLHSILASEIFLYYFRSIWKVLGQHKKHIEGSGLF